MLAPPSLLADATPNEPALWALGEKLKFATPKEIRANPALRAQVHSGDTVIHYVNSRDLEGVGEDGL